MKKNIWIFVLMGAVIIMIYFASIPNQSKLGSADVSAAVVARSAPTYIKSGTTTTLSYTASGINTAAGANFFVFVEDKVLSGGCTPAITNVFWNSPQLVYTGVDLTAPSVSAATTCVLSGTYIFQTGTKKTITPDVTINVCVDQCTGTTDSGCVSSTQKYTCTVNGIGGKCNQKIITTCDSGRKCDPDLKTCTIDCTKALSDAINYARAWVTSPSDSTLNPAVAAALVWANNC